MKKKKIPGLLLSCLACISMLSYSMLPVHAWNPENCEHPGYFSSIEPIKTGVYDYRDDGHYAEYGVGYTCVKCRQQFFPDTTFIFECKHEWERIPSEEWVENGITMEIYDCTDSDCPKRRITASTIF